MDLVLLRNLSMAHKNPPLDSMRDEILSLDKPFINKTCSKQSGSFILI